MYMCKRMICINKATHDYRESSVFHVPVRTPARDRMKHYTCPQTYQPFFEKWFSNWRLRNIQLEFFTGSEHMIRCMRPIRYKRHDRPLGITKPVRYTRYLVISGIRSNRRISIHVKQDFCRDQLLCFVMSRIRYIRLRYKRLRLICKRLWARTCTLPVFARQCTWVCVHVSACKHASKCIHVHLCLCLCVSRCVCVCVCVCFLLLMINVCLF